MSPRSLVESPVSHDTNYCRRGLFLLFPGPIPHPHLRTAGFDISLSMGAFLNASFRANTVSLQNLFCNLTDEPAVVRACSEWFALCLVLLLHPRDEGPNDALTSLSSPSLPHDQQVPSPSCSSARSAPTPPHSAAVSTATTPSSTTMSSVRTVTPFTAGSATAAVHVSTTTGGLRLAGDTKAIPFAVATPPPSPQSQDDESSEAWRLQHGSAGRRRFSKATILALGSLVLARRLARAQGPCLPVRVQEVMGLGNDDALDLVTEGVRLARQAFQTELEMRHPSNETENEELSSGGDIGKSILASEVVFGREVMSSGTTRTLLEWVTDIGDKTRERVASDEPADRLGKVMTAQEECSPPDFLQGVTLSSIAAGVSTTASTYRMPPQVRYHPAVSSNPYSLRSVCGGGDYLSSSSTDANSNESTRGNLLYSGNSSGTAAPQDTSTSPSSCSRSNEGKWGESSGSDYMTASKQTLCCPLPSPPVVPTKNGVETKPPPLRTRQDDDRDDTMEDDSTPPSSSSSSLPSPSSLPSSSSLSSSSNRTASARRPVCAGAGAFTVANALGNTAFSGGRTRGKRVAPEQGGSSGQSSQEGVSAVNKRPRITTGNTSARTRSLPPPAATLSPEQQKNARWAVLIDRVLAALGDDCGCSFCKLLGDGGSGGGPVSGGAVKRPRSLPLPPSSQDWSW